MKFEQQMPVVALNWHETGGNQLSLYSLNYKTDQGLSVTDFYFLTYGLYYLSSKIQKQPIVKV